MNTVRTLAICWLAALVPAASPQAASPQQSARDLSVIGRKALLIGNNAYRAAAPLHNAVNDARDFAELLKEGGFGVTVVQDAELAATERAIRLFADGLRAGDVALFFYAGHGVQIEGENYLIPVDFAATDEIEAKTKSVKMAMVQERMERSGARVNILILDACRNNPLRGSRALVLGMASMDARLGTLIAFSTGPGQTASDNAAERNGLFTKFLLQTLREPVGVVPAFRTVRQRVFEASKGKQRPWLHEDLLDDFYLIAGAEPPRPSPPPVQATPPPLSPAPAPPSVQRPPSVRPTPPPVLQPPPPPPPAKKQTPPPPISGVTGPPRASGAQQALVKGQQLFHAGDYEGALKEFELARRADAGNPYAHNAAGVAYSRLSRFAQAVDCYNQAIRLKPDYAAAYANRGSEYLRAARYEQALGDFNWAIEDEPANAVLFRLRGKANFGLKEYQEAAADFSRALELDPSDAAARHERGRAYSRLGKLREALQDFDEVLRQRPRAADAYEDRAGVRRQLGDAKGEESDRRQAKQLRGR